VDSPQLAIAQYAEQLSLEMQARCLQIPDKSPNSTMTPLLQPRTTPKTVFKIGTMEAQLIEIWENLLQTKPISVEDDFFDLGGNSLLMMVLGAEIEKQFAIKLSLRSLFSASTIEELAKIIHQIATNPSNSWRWLISCFANKELIQR
jgi:acyl carrier protein